MDPLLLKKFYYDMLRIRLVEEKIVALYPQGRMRCPVHLCIGQEAVAVGVCAHLSREDYVLSAHRSHGHYLAKGGDLKAMMAELYGKATGCSRGNGGSMHLVDCKAGFLGAAPILGGTIPIAVGAALGSVMRGEKRLTVVFFGEAATEEGIFHESLNFALLKKLPIVFVCENNLYSVYSPLSVRQPERREVRELAQGHGVESYQANGNDVIEVYQTVEKAFQKVREGPVFLEFKTYRWREHCGPNYDNDLGYRTVAEFETWKKECPVDRLYRGLLKEKIADALLLGDLKRQVEREIEETVRDAEKSPFPDPALLMEHVYAS